MADGLYPIPPEAMDAGVHITPTALRLCANGTWPLRLTKSWGLALTEASDGFAYLMAEIVGAGRAPQVISNIKTTLFDQ